MLSAEWNEGQGWDDPKIGPTENFSLHPGASVFHYSTEVSTIIHMHIYTVHTMYTATQSISYYFMIQNCIFKTNDYKSYAVILNKTLVVKVVTKNYKSRNKKVKSK